MTFGAPTCVQANDWQLDDPSSITFSATQAGATFEGRFERFETQIVFSPDALRASYFKVRVDLSSVETDYGERDEVLRGPEFFDVARSGHALYEATVFEHVGGNEYRAEGVLTIKDRQVPIPLVFNFARTGNGEGSAVLQGETRLNRLDFGIGLGDWADQKWIGHAVTVRFSITLRGKY